MIDRLESLELPRVGPECVLVKMLAAPINPSDLNMLQGKSKALIKHYICIGSEAGCLGKKKKEKKSEMYFARGK